MRANNKAVTGLLAPVSGRFFLHLCAGRVGWAMWRQRTRCTLGRPALPTHCLHSLSWRHLPPLPVDLPRLPTLFIPAFLFGSGLRPRKTDKWVPLALTKGLVSGPSAAGGVQRARWTTSVSRYWGVMRRCQHFMMVQIYELLHARDRLAKSLLMSGVQTPWQW